MKIMQRCRSCGNYIDIASDHAEACATKIAASLASVGGSYAYIAAVFKHQNGKGKQQ